MLTISLDEQGKFEKNISNSGTVGPTYIGGILYDDMNVADEESNERERICRYYKQVVEDASKMGEECKFPRDLHAHMDAVSRKKTNGCQEKNVKQIIQNTLGEFIKYGTYDGKELMSKPRVGQYYIYIYIKSDKGITSLTRKSTNYMSNDEYAGNLYYHMAVEVVDRLALHNPVIPVIKDVSFNIATRVTADVVKNSEQNKEFVELGYGNRSRDEKSNKAYYQLSNPDVYRTALAQEMLNAGKTSLNVKKFLVKPICYENSRNMEFLYLADSICAVLAYQMKGDTADRWIQAINDRANKLNNSDRNLIFIYDDVDVRFASAWKACENKDFYKALELAYGIINGSSVVARYYKKNWVKKLEERICESKDLAALNSGIEELIDSIYTNSYQQDKAMYMFRIFEENCTRNSELLAHKEKEKIVGKLYEAAISVYCHIGDSKGATRYYKKYKQYMGYLGIDDYISVLNKMIVVYLDDFERTKAKNEAKEYIDIQEMTAELRQAISTIKGEELKQPLALAKAYSQMGQVLAFRQEAEAEEYFTKALNCMPKDTANYKITQSYLLHYYIDSDRANEYENLATEYFGGQTTIGKRLKYIYDNAFVEFPIINYKYALYLLIKGIYTFDMDKITIADVEKLFDVNEALRKAEKNAVKGGECYFSELEGHPCEIIYKYLMLIAIRFENVDKANEFNKFRRTCINNAGDTVELINLYSDIVCYEKLNNEPKANQAIEVIKNELVAKYSNLKYISDVSDDEVSTELKKWLVYMYV